MGVVDFSEMTDMQVTPAEIRRIVEINRLMAEAAPRAVVAVVAPNPLPYAMARLWLRFSTDFGWNGFVFENRAKAVDWLRRELSQQDGRTAVPEKFPSLGRA